MALEILAFGPCGFGIWDSEDFGIRDLGLCGFWILRIGMGIGHNGFVNGLGNYGIGE